MLGGTYNGTVTSPKVDRSKPVSPESKPRARVVEPVYPRPANVRLQFDDDAEEVFDPEPEGDMAWVDLVVDNLDIVLSSLHRAVSTLRRTAEVRRGEVEDKLRLFKAHQQRVQTKVLENEVTLSAISLAFGVLGGGAGIMGMNMFSSDPNERDMTMFWAVTVGMLVGAGLLALGVRRWLLQPIKPWEAGKVAQPTMKRTFSRAAMSRVDAAGNVMASDPKSWDIGVCFKRTDHGSAESVGSPAAQTNPLSARRARPDEDNVLAGSVKNLYPTFQEVPVVST